MAAKPKSSAKTGRDSLVKLRAYVDQVHERLGAAESANERAIAAIQKAFAALGADSQAEAEAVRAHTDRLATHLNDLIIKTRKDVSTDLRKALSNPKIETISLALQAADKRLTASEQKHTDIISKVHLQINELSQNLEKKINDQNLIIQEMGTQFGERIDALANSTDSRFQDIEAQTAKAISAIGDRIVTLSDEINSKNEKIEQNASERIYETALDSQQEIESLKAELKTELDRHQNNTQDIINTEIIPLQRQIATLSAKLEAYGAGLPINDISSQQDMPPPFPDSNFAPAQPVDAFSPAPPALSEQAISPPPLEQQNLQASPVAASSQAPEYQNMDNVGAPAPLPEDFSHFENVTPFNPPQPTPHMPQGNPYQDTGGYNVYGEYAENPYAQASSAANPYAEPQSHAMKAPAAEWAPGMPPPIAEDFMDELTMDNARPGSPKTELKDGKKSKSLLRTAASAAAILAIATFGALTVKNRFIDRDSTPRTAQSAPQITTPQIDLTLSEPAGQIVQADGSVERASTVVNADLSSLDAAVGSGDAIAQLQKGLSLMQAGDKEKAVELIRLSANQGQAAAQYYLGHMYENGDGVSANSETAYKYTSMAAQAGHRIAMYDLALYYIEGKGGVSADMSKAANWFRKAADHGMVDAQYNLAVLYERGTGVPQDIAESYVWFSVAGQYGDQDSANRAEQLRGALDPDALGRAEARIAGFKPAQINEAVNGIFRDLPWQKQSAPARDPQVVQVQQFLTDLGYEAGIADGAMGPKTRNAIKSFERDNGLTETGEINESLLSRLSLASGA